MKDSVIKESVMDKSKVIVTEIHRTLERLRVAGDEAVEGCAVLVACEERSNGGIPQVYSSVVSLADNAVDNNRMKENLRQALHSESMPTALGCSRGKHTDELCTEILTARLKAAQFVVSQFGSAEVLQLNEAEQRVYDAALEFLTLNLTSAVRHESAGVQ